MKLILLTVIIGFSSSYAYLAESDFGEKLLPLTKIWHNKCVSITGVTQATIDDLKNGIFVENEKTKRYTLCLWLVSDVMNPDFTLNKNLLKELIPKKLVRGYETYLDCANRAKESAATEPHEKVWEVVKCVYNSNPNDFLMF